MVENSQEKLSESEPKKREETGVESIKERKNKGRLMLDATCAPSDLNYPQDLKLLNKGRSKTEKIIDRLYEQVKGQVERKPKTYREIARKDYLKVAKKRRPYRKETRKAIRKQLQYIKRNIGHIEALIQAGAGLDFLSPQEYKSLLVVGELYRQQEWMYNNKTQRIENRIVSISQPHIRPIVRGKAGSPVEFGAKLSVSWRDGYIFLDRIDWENFNEALDLKAQVEGFKEATGFYPESLHVDRIYRTRSNRAFCKERGIRISGLPLGRPPAFVSDEKKRQAREDERIRNAIEGKFGVSKRRFSLNRIMTKLPHTSQTAIGITFLVMNLSTLLRQVLLPFFVPQSLLILFGKSIINLGYDWRNYRGEKLMIYSELNN